MPGLRRSSDLRVIPHHSKDTMMSEEEYIPEVGDIVEFKELRVDDVMGDLVSLSSILLDGRRTGISPTFHSSRLRLISRPEKPLKVGDIVTYGRFYVEPTLEIR